MKKLQFKILKTGSKLNAQMLTISGLFCD